MIKIILTAQLNFENGYGINVIRLNLPGILGSYTDNETEWECAVLKNGGITYETPLTDDVIGHLSESEVTDLMKQIQELPKDIGI